MLKVGRVGWSGPSNGVGPGHATGSDSDSDGEENGQLAWADGVLGGGQHWHGPDAHAEAHHAVHGDVPGGVAGDGEDSELDDAVLGCMPHLHTLCSSGWPMPAIDTALSIPAAGDSDVWAACASTGASAVAAASVNPAAAAAPADGCWPMDSNSSGDASSSSSSSRGQANSSRLHQQLDEYVCVHAHAADAYRWGLPGLPRLLRAMPALHTLCGVWLALEWPAAGQSEGMPQLHQAEAPGQGFAPPFPVHGMMTMDAAALHGDVPGAHWGVAVEEAAAAEQLLGRLAGSGGCWGLELVLPTRPPVVTAAAGAGAAHVDYMHLDLDDHPHNHMPLFNGAGASQQQQQQLNTQPLHAHEHGIVHRSRRPLHALMYLPQVQHLSVALDVDSLLTPFIAQELAVTFPNVHSLRLEYATAGLRSMHLITHALSQLKTLWLDLSGHLSLPLSLSHSSLPSVTPTAAAAAGMAAGSGVATAGLSSSIGASAWTHGSSGGASHAVEDWVLKLVAGLVAMCVRHSALACVHVHGLGEAALHAVTSALDACGEQCVVRPWHKEP